MFRNRTLWAVVILLMLVQSGVVFSRVSDERIREMQERAEKEGWPFTVGRNAATERSSDVLCGALPPDPNDPLLKAMLAEFDERVKTMGQASVPDAFDWRDYGKVPPIRDQGNCGSCYAFSAVGVVESAILINSELSANEMDLSEQWVLSCVGGSCQGGFTYYVFDAMKWDPSTFWDDCGDEGAVLEEDFPYTASDITPCGCPYRHPYGIEDYHYAGFGEGALKQVIYEYGSISAMIDVYESFELYNGGIYDRNEGAWAGRHYVNLVGWDDNLPDGPGFWILRNSWGPNWGEEGYMWITYGIFNTLTTPYYPQTRYVDYVWDKDPLEGHWKFDEGEGTTAEDSVGDNNGTLVNDPIWWTSGKINSALKFAYPVDDYVELPEAVIIRDEYEKSICAWVYVDFWHDYATILRWYDGRNLTMTGFYTEGRIGGVLDSRLSPAPVTVDAICPAFEWHHVCYMYDGLTTSIYVDGNKQATSEEWYWGLPSQGDKAYIGRDSFDGIIDDVRVYNWALDTFEIWDAMSGDLPRFRIKDSSGETVAWFDSFGNLFLKGEKLEDPVDPIPPGSFIIKDSEDVPVAYIDNEGNLWIEGEELGGGCDPEGDAFIIRNSSDTNVSYIDFANGDLCLTGELYQNPEQ